MSTQITALAVSKSCDGKLVLDEVTCALAAGERTGIIGENGSGRTTLLHLFAQQEQPDHGEIVVQAEGGVGYLAQEEQPSPHLMVQQVIDRALAELRSIEERMRRLEAAMAADDESGQTVLAAIVRGRTGETDQHAERLLSLGLFDHTQLTTRIENLSTGQRQRLALAQSVSEPSTCCCSMNPPTTCLQHWSRSWKPPWPSTTAPL
ncbi:ATP-binding cassette domain-containing protein [Nocardia sp. NPDC004604]|uniref:ATP-binding cassette domain-containing protein n=1 Tax=Nocardia sp. NPDC004604 TaxID=3157013 RepID=UPI0033A5D2F2